MKRPLIFAVTLALSTSALCGQSATEQAKSREEILEQVAKMDAEGVRLTPKGWYKTAQFFTYVER